MKRFKMEWSNYTMVISDRLNGSTVARIKNGYDAKKIIQIFEQYPISYQVNREVKYEFVKTSFTDMYDDTHIKYDLIIDNWIRASFINYHGLSEELISTLESNGIILRARA